MRRRGNVIGRRGRRRARATVVWALSIVVFAVVGLASAGGSASADSVLSQVPGVQGLSQTTATTTLQQAGFGVAVDYLAVADPSWDGIVIAQDPAGGTTGTTGEIVVITVGQLSDGPYPPLAGVAPGALNFGDTAVGSSGGQQTVTISNAAPAGNGNLLIGSVTIEGMQPDAFRLGTNSCTSATLSPGASCTVDVSFHPTSVGSLSAILRISSNAASSPDDVALSGTGTSAATISISGDAPDGTVGLPYSFSYTTSGDSSIAFLTNGALPPGLTIDSTTGTLSGTPTTAGGYMFTVTAIGAGGEYATLDDAIVISPAATPPPAFGSSPASVAFGNQAVGTTSAQRTVTITNTATSGSDSLVLDQLAPGGADAGDFTLSNDTCSHASVPPGSSCTVDVSFAPTQAGPRDASLSVPSNAPSSPDSVALSGNGTTTPSADVRVSVSGPTSGRRGTQVTYLITVSNVGPSGAHNVVLSDPIPTGTSFLGVTSTQGTCVLATKPAAIRCSLGDLAGGGSAGSAVSVKLTAKVGSSVTNLVSATSVADSAGPATPDPDTSNNWASLTTSVQK